MRAFAIVGSSPAVVGAVGALVVRIVAAVTSDLHATVHGAIKPPVLAPWIRETRP